MKKRNRMVGYAGWLMALVLCGAGPTTAPATQPSRDELVASLNRANQLLREAQAKCAAALKATTEYKTAREKRVAAEATLARARKAGSAQDKLAASHDFVVADQTVKNLESTAIATDPDVKSATQSRAVAQAAISTFDSSHTEALIAEQSKFANDPIHVAIREGRITTGMTEEEADVAFRNRKRRNLEEGTGGGGGTINMSVNQALGTVNAPPGTLVRKTHDDLLIGQRVTFTKYLRYMNGSEYRIDEVGVLIRDGKVIEIYGQ